jgi:hypothetical protein
VSLSLSGSLDSSNHEDTKKHSEHFWIGDFAVFSVTMISVALGLAESPGEPSVVKLKLGASLSALAAPAPRARVDFEAGKIRSRNGL